MASAASSDQVQGGLRLPPLSALPRDVTVESLPGLGTTWVDRGAAYWLRRAGLALMWAVVVTLVTAIVIGFLGGIRSSSRTGFYAALAVEVAWSLAIIGWFIVGTVRRWNDAAPPRRLTGRSRRAGRAGRPGQAGRDGAALGVLARSGFLIGQVFLVVGSLFFLGLYVALFLTYLLPEIPAERQARLRLSQALRARGYTPPEG
jgi:hypothetical protein